MKELTEENEQKEQKGNGKWENGQKKKYNQNERKKRWNGLVTCGFHSISHTETNEWLKKKREKK